MQSSDAEKNCNGKLPRGLINRGANQRLPSLRSDPSSSKTSLLTTTTASTTRGGILKRTFKPNIPNCVKKCTTEEANNNTNDTKEHIKAKDSPHTSRRGRPPKNKHKANEKHWIQTEGAVFKGESNPNLRSNREREEAVSRKKSSNSTEVRVKLDKEDVKSTKVKREDYEDVDDYIGDDFVVDDHISKNLLFPIGWHTVTRHRKSQPEQTRPALVEPLNPYNLFDSHSPEKLLLFQMPENIVNRSEGHIGKIKVFKSGRIEFEDSETKIKFDILFDSEVDYQRNVKQEDDARVKPNAIQESSDLSEDIVSFDGNDLCALASLENKQVLMAVPTIPLNNMAIEKIL